MSAQAEAETTLQLLWIPLGAGQHVVRISGWIYEATAAFVRRRPRCALYHSALTVSVPDGRYVIEMTPVLDAHGSQRGVVAEGPVGLRSAGRLRIFRYEIRCWRDGVIPDLPAAKSRKTIALDSATANKLLTLVPSVPTWVWGRDELDVGDMWNSNSVTSWLLCASGIDLRQFAIPRGGRAPGWNAGIAAARRVASGSLTLP